MEDQAILLAQTHTGHDKAAKSLENLRMRLLDLTSRNRLINFRHTKNGSLRIIDELPDQLVEILLAEKEMRFLPVPEPTREELIEVGYIRIDAETGHEIRLKKDPTAEEWAKRLGLSTDYEVPAPSGESRDGKHADTAIQTLLYAYELESRLKNLLQTSETAIEEMGANILYLAFGFLEWFESNNDTARTAPLFLVPVRLHKGRLNPANKTYDYTLSYSGEDLIPNLSLREKLRADFGLALPELDENATPEEYIDAVRELIKDNQTRWKVRRYITMVLLNFSKLLMYLDLDPIRWPEGKSILDHRVVTRFLAGYEFGDKDRPGIGFGEEHVIDDLADIHAKYPLIEDADSSQHSALIDAIDGKDLVIEGPPGTGKSQTITNLIAAAIAQGKRVLFVAEKLAALEVVRRRLDAAGLGDFCLELHSHKSQKRKVLDEVNERINKRRKYRKPKEIDVDIARFEELKTQLKNHVERINRPWKQTRRTLHEIFMAATRYRELVAIPPDSFHPTGYNGDNLDLAAQRRTEDQVQAFRKVYKAVAAQLDGDAELQSHPWYGVRNADLQIFDLDRVTDKLRAWQKALSDLADEREQIASTLGCDSAEVPDSLSGLSAMSTDFGHVPTLAGDELLDRLPALRGEYRVKAQRYLDLFEKIQASYAALGKVVDHDALRDLGKVDTVAAGAEQLARLVNREIDLAKLAISAKKLTEIAEKLGEFNEPLAEIRGTVGDAAGALLQPTEAGLLELANFIETVARLAAAHWKERNDAFDNDELDELLPAIRDDLEKLHGLRDQISGALATDLLPAATELRQLEQTLARSGPFSWFNRSWRAARKQALRYAVTPQVRFSVLQPLITQAAEFAERRDAFNGSSRYRAALGERIDGLDTDIAGLEALRSWYRAVRREYGVGFGKRVAVGEALLNLPINLVRALRSLAERGKSSRIRALIGDLQSLKPVFSPVASLQRDDTPLLGDETLFSKLIKRLTITLKACEPIETDGSATVDQVLGRIEQLKSLKKNLATWGKTEFDRKVFQGRLGLQTGLDVDNHARLLAAKNTFATAAAVDQLIQTPAIQAYLYAQPTTKAFNEVKLCAAHLRSTEDSHRRTLENFADIVALDHSAWITRCGDQVNALVKRNQAALDHPDALQNWLDYVRARDQLEDLGLVKLAERIEKAEIDIEQTDDAYNAGIYDLLAREILREQPELARFSGHSQQALQEKFAEYDNRLKRLQSERIAWQIDQQKVPEGCPGPRASDRTELFLLKHECGKKTRHLPIRQVLQRASGALAALKPCFMMGPMSVAQYLAPGQIDFDIVVMDEASQIKPQDALGAIARGAQLVVVGDPKQLPPTSFFDRLMDDGAENPTGIEESESILDATLPIFPGRRLRWHYRSQHENLIAFSNHSFYDSDLVLFPSPHSKTANYGIQYSLLKRGCFVNRRNMEEARVIAEAVREHFRHHPKESLGVVAMSAEQRQQIEGAIETLTKEDPAFNSWRETDGTRQESLFIKNLENVQGDERDVIFISMTYGPPEPGGKVMQRFGPINSDVGWRRLNVLFTRSKKRMHIFSSMGSEDIVAGTTSKRGVHALRDFLSYCETGILHKTERETGRAPDSDFELAVAAALRNAGFECIPQVGVAGFFIDVAVVDPANPGRYLMGIECDGATYHSAKSVRDRDRLRQAVLERLGWRIRRIWSTDWFKNPHAELQPILRELHAIKSEPAAADLPPEASEGAEIQKIVAEDDHQMSMIEDFIVKDGDLRTKLTAFDRSVIRSALPETPEHKRMLRPAVLEALLEFTPTSREEFLEAVPAYLRQATEAAEGKYLDQVFEIINASLEHA